MNIQLNQKSIRVRLNSSDYERLVNKNQLRYEFNYLLMNVNINIIENNQISFVTNSSLEINLDKFTLKSLTLPDCIKHGATLLAHGINNKEITIEIQVDLHNKK